MITIMMGDLLQSKAQTLVNTVNCVGVMGKGIALEFKNRFPVMHADYVRRCKVGLVRLGEPYLFRGLDGVGVLNFPTKDHWRSSSRLADIEAGLEFLRRHHREWGIESLAVPPLGCGNGGLDWAIVGPLLYQHFADYEIPVEIYAPLGTHPSRLSIEFLAGEADASVSWTPKPVPAAAVALAEIVARITDRPVFWPVGRITFQKIAYFATEAGIPTGLHFVRGSFGPFAGELKQLTTVLVNNGVLEEERRGRMFSVRPGHGYESAVRANAEALRVWEPAIRRVTDLFLRISRTEEAEVAATVKFVATEIAQEKGAATESEIWWRTLAWKRDRLSETAVKETVRNLNVLGWIQADYSSDLTAGLAEPDLVSDPV